jgi:hypothetical protein
VTVVEGVATVAFGVVDWIVVAVDAVDWVVAVVGVATVVGATVC